MTAANTNIRRRPGALTGAVLLALTAGLASTTAVADATSTQGPSVSLTAAAAGDALAPGAGVPGAGSADGTGFAINVEAETDGRTGIAVKEGLDIRHTDQLGGANPDFPGLVVTVDNTLTKPDGGTIPAGTNLAPLFNIAGTDDTPGPGVTVWAGWHVLESLAPGTATLTFTASVTDENGNTGTAVETYDVSAGSGLSGQALTPTPGAPPEASGVAGPRLALRAPVRPTSVALGTLPQPNLSNGTLFFIQLDALDVAGHGIGVNENASGKGQVVDASQIAVAGPNRNFPGLDFTFDADLRQPNGNLVPAGQNLAPLFNVAGSTIGPDGAIRTTFDWVVGGSLELAPGQRTLTMTATVTDDAGGVSTVTRTMRISAISSGQLLTPQP